MISGCKTIDRISFFFWGFGGLGGVVGAGRTACVVSETSMNHKKDIPVHFFLDQKFF